MVSVEEAYRLILECVREPLFADLRIKELSEDVLAESVYASHAYPPFDRVAMDGIAIFAPTWESGQRVFQIEDCQKAGDPRKKLTNPLHCLEVMTGAILPEGTDLVVPYEDFMIDVGRAILPNELKLKHRQNIHLKGSDCDVGAQLLSRGEYLTSMHWPVIASEGLSKVKVFKRPTVSIVSTGSELVDVGDKVVESHQVHLSNPYAILSALRSANFHNVAMHHYDDKVEEVYLGLKQALSESDVLIVTGGVSKGKYDFVPQVFNDLGVQRVFHRVAQKPGKPLWFGQGPQGQLVFGLPGNPVSVQVCFHRYVLPALLKTIGVNVHLHEHQGAFAVLAQDITFDNPLTYFPAVKIDYDRSGFLRANPLESNGSGDFVSIRNSDGFLQLPPKQSLFRKGEAFPFFEWKGRL